MVLEQLAQRYQQLYLTPGEEMEETYRDVVLRGKAVGNPSLALFHGSPQDKLWMEDTPAGPVEILYLGDREDFENFLRLTAYKCRPVKIPPTTGAMALTGLINWQKIQRHQEEYTASGKTDWPEERSRFLSVRENYKDMLIVISDGPYSGVPWDSTGYPAQEWLEISRKIRVFHECTHVICRRKFPELKDAIWDEVAADAIGLIGATGDYDATLASLFMGVNEEGYIKGRLENYVGQEDAHMLWEISVRVYALIHKISTCRREMPELGPYEFLNWLEENKNALWEQAGEFVETKG